MQGKRHGDDEVFKTCDNPHQWQRRLLRRKFRFSSTLLPLFLHPKSKKSFLLQKKNIPKKSHCSILSSLTMQERVSFSKTGSKILRHSLLLCLPLRQTYKFTKKREVNSWTVINKRFLDQKFLFRTVS